MVSLTFFSLKQSVTPALNNHYNFKFQWPEEKWPEKWKAESSPDEKITGKSEISQKEDKNSSEETLKEKQENDGLNREVKKHN